MRNLQKSPWPIRTNIPPVYKVPVPQIARSLDNAVEVLFPVLYFSLENCKQALSETGHQTVWSSGSTQGVCSTWISMCKTLYSAYFELLFRTLLSSHHRFSPASSISSWSSLPRPKDVNNFLYMEQKEFTKLDPSKLLVWN